MKRALALGAIVALVSALAIPAGAASKESNFALSGEARGLDLAIGDQGLTLGMALAEVDSTPTALGVGAGTCILLGANEDPDGLPCTAENTVRSAFPGDPGTDELLCTGSLPAPLSDILDLKLACGSSKSGLKKGVAFTHSKGQVASLQAKLPVGLNLVPLDTTLEQVDQIVDSLTQTLAPVLGVAPQQVRDVLTGAQETVDETKDEAVKVVNGLLEIIQGVDATDALKIELGTSLTRIERGGDTISSESDAAGARIGVLGIPSVGTDGSILQPADPLKNGLVIIEVGTARASASVNRATADSASAASPALVTVKVRDITSPTPKYVEVSVAPGQTVTLLQGTPAESTITAADSTTEQSPGSARAVADAVKLHLLKGVNGGVKLGIAGANAAAEAEVIDPKLPVPPAKRPPRTLPVTGAENMTIVAVVMMLAAAGVFGLRRRFNN
ncbi:MAG: LPXTG cell wall anchor domain-containing protein [Actinomycetota bacterium]